MVAQHNLLKILVRNFLKNPDQTEFSNGTKVTYSLEKSNITSPTSVPWSQITHTSFLVSPFRLDLLFSSTRSCRVRAFTPVNPANLLVESLLASVIMYARYPRRRRNGYVKRRFVRRGPPMYRQPAIAARASAPVVRPDLKYSHHGFSCEPSIGNPICRLLSNLDLGVSATTRAGNSVQPVSLYGYITINGDPDGSTASNYGVRVGFAQWLNDQSRDQFNARDLMLDETRPGGPFNVASKGMFKILWSRYVIVYNKGDNARICHTERYRVNLRRAPKVMFEGDETLKANQLFFFTLSDDSNGTSPPSVEVDVMFRYND